MVSRHGERSMDELVERVTRLLHDGDLQGAREAVGEAPPGPAAIGHAIIALHERDSDAALAYAERAIELGADAAGHQHAALAHLLAGGTDAALEHARRAVELQPSYQARSTYATVVLAAGQPAEAARLLRILSAERSDDTDVLLALGAAAAQVGDYGAAIASYARAFDRTPSDDRPIENLLHMFAHVGRWLGAAAALDLSRQGTPPPDVEVALDMVQVRLVRLIANGFPERALDADTDRTVDRLCANARGRSSETLLVVAQTLLELGRDAEARESVAEVAARGDVAGAELGLLRFLEGVFAERSGDRAAALDRYAEALAADPLATDACTNAVSLLLETGRLDEVPSWIAKVPAHAQRTSARLLFNESVYLARTQRKADAIARLERVLELTEQDDPIAELATQHLAALR
jgi:tetratricopeptide (TPR) repeat protein